jgi:succinate dehydrogenase / fumarate reductase cytochrome b subunit
MFANENCGSSRTWCLICPTYSATHFRALDRKPNFVLSLGAVGVVVWPSAAALGPRPYAAMQETILSWPGQIVLFTFTFAFFLHLCGGIRHLVCDTVHGFELRSIYASG